MHQQFSIIRAVNAVSKEDTCGVQLTWQAGIQLQDVHRSEGRQILSSEKCTDGAWPSVQEAALSALPVRAAKAARTAITLVFLFWLWGRPALFLESR